MDFQLLKSGSEWISTCPASFPGKQFVAHEDISPVVAEEVELISSEIEAKFLKPQAPTARDPKLLGNLQKICDRPVNWDAFLVHTEELFHPTYFNGPRLTWEREGGRWASHRLIGYTQTLQESKSSGVQSLSFSRRPEHVSGTGNVKGSSRNVPFAFGGMMDDLISDNRARLDIMEDLEAEFDLKICAPGLSRGLRGFDQSEKFSFGPMFSTIQSEIGTVVESLDETADQKHLVEGKKAGDKEAQGASEDAMIEKLVGDTRALSLKVSKPSKSIQKTYARMLDTSTAIPDDEFRQFVPELAKEYPFQLDTFQKQAVIHLEKGDCVFVAAHTSAGKTVVAEYAIALAQKHMTRAIYTSPIKALSNQKFRDFRNTFGEEEVGLLTGDVQIRPEASCIIMTTEILRSMLYRGADIIRDVEFVIFDEVHYINDIERGVVWEEVIIMLPAHVSIILLSATVPNTFQFADWVGRTKRRDIYVISTQKRPVPLEHYLFISSALPHDLYKVVDSNKQFFHEGYKKAWDKVHVVKDEKKKPVAPGKKQNAPQVTKPTKQVQPTMRKFGSSNDRNTWVHLTNLLKKRTLLPVVIFTFSKKRCEENADTLSNLDLMTSLEKSEVHVFVERSLSRLAVVDRDLPQILRMREMLSRGIGVHHSGLLPIVKELVEILFARNLLKVLFATETFAMGVNMPARCVVFSGTRKHDGRSFRDLLPGEYTQMSGRAGRRGLDDTGVVILTCGGSEDFPAASSLQEMILGQPTKLESQFRLTYNMILNLLRIEAFKVEDMMKRSFFEDESQRDLPEQEKLMKQHENKLSSIPKLSCQVCQTDIDVFYQLNTDFLALNREVLEIALFQSASGLKLMSSRVILVNQGQYRNVPAVFIRPVGANESVSSALRDKSFWCLLIHEKDAILESRTVQDESSFAAMPLTILNVPVRQNMSWSVLPIRYNHILIATKHKIRIADPHILTDEKKRTDEEVRTVVQQLMDVAEEMKSYNMARKPIPEVELDSKIKDLEFREAMFHRKQILHQINKFQCVHCPDFEHHYALVSEVQQIKETMAQLQYRLSDKNLHLMPDYHQRIAVLKELKHVDEAGSVQLKGRVACEINSGESLVLTELIMDNLFTPMKPQEIVALLAAFIFQEKSDVSVQDQLPDLPSAVQIGIDVVVSTAAKIAEIQRQQRLDVSPEDFIRDTLHFGLTRVVYEWADGTAFKDIVLLTDVLEGSIVRCITRLDELCREIRDASRVIGNAVLYKKMEEASALIKRDIVFAASLYV